MEKIYTQLEIEEIRLAFEGPHGRGLLADIVFSEYDRETIHNVEPKKVVQFFSLHACGGVVRMMHALQNIQEEGLYEFGSHSIDLYRVADGPFSFENAGTFVGVTIGNTKVGMTPIEWLAYLSRGFDRLSEIQQSGFDDVCRDLSYFLEASTSTTKLPMAPLGKHSVH